MSNQISSSVGILPPKVDIAPAAPNQTDVQPSSKGDVITPQVSATESIQKTREFDKANRHQPGVSKDSKADAVERPAPGEGNATSEELEELAAELNEKIRGISTSIQFSVDEDYSGILIKVIDNENDEVIRQIPPPDAVALAKFLREVEEHGDATKLAELSHASSQGGLSVEGLLLHAKA